MGLKIVFKKGFDKMKIKIIDLLNKIANNEEVPKKIKYKDNVYYLGKNIVDLHTYQTEGSNTTRKLSLIIDNEYLNLNDYVEIIEEPKKIEKIDEILRIDDLIPPYGENEYKAWKNIIIQQNKINELIDEINNLKDK